MNDKEQVNTIILPESFREEASSLSSQYDSSRHRINSFLLLKWIFINLQQQQVGIPTEKHTAPATAPNLPGCRLWYDAVVARAACTPLARHSCVFYGQTHFNDQPATEMPMMRTRFMSKPTLPPLFHCSYKVWPGKHGEEAVAVCRGRFITGAGRVALVRWPAVVDGLPENKTAATVSQIDVIMSKDNFFFFFFLSLLSS